MAILDILKKRKKVEEKKEVKKPPEIKIEKKPKKPKKIAKEVEVKPQVPRAKAKIQSDAYRILKEPHITEKATDLGKKDKYVFKVYSGANKIEIKKAIEDLYGVDVLRVNIIQIHPKTRRLGRTRGQRKGYKKAIIKIRKGQKIELLPR